MNRAEFNNMSTQERFEPRPMVQPPIETPLLVDAKVMTSDSVSATQAAYARDAMLVRAEARHDRPEDVTGVVLSHKV